MIVKGQEVAFVALILLIGITIYLIRKGGSIPPIRKIAGLEAVREAIGRAAETGRPVFYTPGAGGVSSASSAKPRSAIAASITGAKSRSAMCLTPGNPTSPQVKMRCL